MGFLSLLWALIIFAGTCTSNANVLLAGRLEFTFNPDPRWPDLLAIPSHAGFSEIEFAAHFLLFFVLNYLLTSFIGKITTASVVAFLYGIIIELLQIYFGRGAEVIDVIANFAGILVCSCMIWILNNIHSKQNHDKVQMKRASKL